MKKTVTYLFLAVPLAAQGPLSLDDAVRLALQKHPSVAASESAVKGAGMRITEARSGYLPKLNYQESATRSNNPVFVFSSLLTQHQFTEANFAIDTLNRPGFHDNFQSLITVDQMVYDAGQTGLAMKSARLGQNVTEEQYRGTRMQSIANVVRAYHGAELAQEALNVANEAVKSAEADLKRAEAIRAAGMSTEADVLSIRVHLAHMREDQIRRHADLQVAAAALNEALGLPLSEPHELTTPLTTARLAPQTLGQYEKQAGISRPELKQAQLATELAETQRSSAKSSYLPQVMVRAGFEADRQTFVDRGGTNWIASASLRWNLFNGGADKARTQEAEYAIQQARALRNQADAQVQLQVRQAFANFGSANERIDVAQAAVSMAEESLRITKNRYENGLNTVTDLLRTETALLEARNRYLAAVYDQRLAAVNLSLAAGTLNENSEVLR